MTDAAPAGSCARCGRPASSSFPLISIGEVLGLNGRLAEAAAIPDDEVRRALHAPYCRSKQCVVAAARELVSDRLYRLHHSGRGLRKAHYPGQKTRR